jgi:molybdate-binding protein
VTSSSRQGIIAVEDGLADIACISVAGVHDFPEGSSLINGYVRELGLMSKDPDILNMNWQCRISYVSWPRNSEMSRLFHSSLRDIGIDQGAALSAGAARTHFAVAYAVASGRAHIGFGARMVAEKAGLHFKKIASDRIDFLVAKSSLEEESIKVFVAALKSADIRSDKPAGILIDSNVGEVLS